MLVGYSAYMRLASLVFAVTLVASASAAAVELYRWVDKDGLVHYSDQPGPGAEKITVQSVPTIGTTPVKDTIAEPPPPAAFSGYERFVVAQPPNNETVRDNTGAVTVSLELVPALQVELGHTVRVTLAGQTQGGAALQFSFAGIERGTHTVTAMVLDKDGVPIKTASSTFTLHKISKLLGPKPSTSSNPSSSGANAPAAGGGNSATP